MASQSPNRPVLVDTPVWEAYLRREERTYQEINSLMDSGRVCSLDIVVAELLQRAENEEEMKLFQDFTRMFPILSEPTRIWEEAARQALELRRRGKPLPLRDCYIVAMTRVHKVFLYTTNRKLLHAGKALKLKLFPKGRTAK